MEINVRLSAGLAQVTGQSRLQCIVADDATVGDLVTVLLAQYPALNPRLHHAVPMLAGQHVTLQAPLEPDQEVAFLLPVAGGCSRH